MLEYTYKAISSYYATILRHSFFFCAFVPILLCLPNSSYGQSLSSPDSIHQLPEVVVSGKRVDRSLRGINPINKISDSEIQKLALTDLAAILKSFSSVSIRDYGGVGGLKTVSVRGLDAKYTSVSFDGVPMGDVESGQIDIGRLSPHHLQSISLSTGSSDNLLQPARVQGVSSSLDLRSKEPELEQRSYSIWAQMRKASFGTIEPVLGVAHKLSPKLSHQLAIDGLYAAGNYPFEYKQNGYTETSKRENSEVKTLHGSYDLFWKPMSGKQLHTKLYALYSDRELPGSLVLYNPFNKESLLDKRMWIQSAFRSEPSDTPWAYNIHAKYDNKYTRYTDINNKYSSGIQIDKYWAQEYYAGATLRYGLPQNAWKAALGADYWYNILDNTLPDQLLPRRHSFKSVATLSFNKGGLKAMAMLTAFFSREKIRVGTAAGNKEHLSPSLSLTYSPSFVDGLMLRTSWQDLYRVPTFNELYYHRIGSHKLRPERGQMLNIGLTYGKNIASFLPWLSVQVDVYQNRVKDKIVAIPTVFLWTMANVGTARHRGLDVQLQSVWQFGDRLKLSSRISYSYQQAIDLSDSQSIVYKHQLPYIPKHSGSATLSMEIPWLTIGYVVHASGSRYSNSYNSWRSYMPAYTDHSVSLLYPFKWIDSQWQLQLAARNLGNKNYELIKYYPMPGRSYEITLKYHY